MLYKKFQMLAQIVGCVTIGLLAIYGLLMVLSGDSPVWAAIGQAATLAGEEIPSTFNYQGFLRDPDGSLTTGSYTITARIYDLATEGSVLYETTVPNVTVRDGLFNIVLGDDPPMGAEAFSDVPRYIGISLNGDPELIPRQRLHAVPWALTAKTLVSDATLQNVTMSGSVGIRTTQVPTIPLLVGQETGGTKLVLNDIPTARWGFDTANYTLSFRSDNCDGAPCGDDPATWPARLELQNDGDISWSGHLLNMIVTAEYSVESWHQGWQWIDMVPDQNSICFLTRVVFEDIDDNGEQSRCIIEQVGGFWRLFAFGDSGNDNEALCSARCLQW